MQMFTLLHMSLLADASLSCILIFLWLIHRSDRHALLWGIAQLSLAFMSLYWDLGEHAPLATMRNGIITASFVLSLMGFWFGTRYFCGLPKLLRKSLVVFSGLALVTYVLIIYRPQWAICLAPSLLGPLLLWCGVQLSRTGHDYRVVGLILILRGLVNLAFSFSLATNAGLDDLFILSFAAKNAATLALIYAVLRETRQRLRATINSMGNGFMIGDAQGIIRVANDKFASLIGFSTGAELTGRAFWEILPRLTPELAAARFQQIAAPGAKLPLIKEELILRQDGTFLPIESISNIYMERGQPMRMVQIFDITERLQQRDALQHAANTDELCGLSNRHALNRRLKHALAACRDNGEECSLMFIDLDHFKRVNDSLGHSAGDQLLIMVAARLQALVEPKDILARFGGDEFIIVQPDLPAGTGAAAARLLARKIITDFATPFNLAQNAAPFSLYVTPSIGIALSPEHGLDPESLIKGADIAMYAAKTAGRNEFCLFDNSMDDASRSSMLIEEAMHHALQHNEFKLVYQPIVSAGNGRLHKVEALIRWNSPTLGFVPPDRFIPVAEESGMIIEIGSWVLQEACRQARIWADNDIGPICISVNVSAWQLVGSEFLSCLRKAIASNGIRPQQIEIELTERVLIEEASTVRDVLEAVHAMGVSISLDDFGTGYSSLSYLTRFRLNTLKIDRSFITHIEDNERDSALVRAIIAMGHSLKLQMVAEGVETQGQADMLFELGCQSLQGYLFSRPVPPEQIQPDKVQENARCAFSDV